MWIIKNELQGSKMKPGPVHKLKTIKRAMNSVWSDHGHDAEIQNSCIYILNTTNAICGENMNLRGFKEVYKQRNIYVLIFGVDHNGMAGHLTGSDGVGF